MPDFKPHSFKLTTHLMIPKAQHLDALSGQELVPPCISRALVRESVPAPVQFHG